MTGKTASEITRLPRADHLPVLEASDVTVSYGGVKALSGVDIAVPPATIIGLVGPNGAGKTTLFGVMSGLVRADTGKVRLMGNDVSRLSPRRRARLGLARTFQQPRLFTSMTVREHITLADRLRYSRQRMWKDLVTAGGFARPDIAERQRVDQVLALLGLYDVADERVATLPLGLTRLVEVGQAVASAPAVIMLDEPSAGLNPQETERLSAGLAKAVAEQGVGLLLVEHDVELVLGLSSSVVVLEFGTVIAVGTPAEVRHDARVHAAYIGTKDSNE